MDCQRSGVSLRRTEAIVSRLIWCKCHGMQCVREWACVRMGTRWLESEAPHSLSSRWFRRCQTGDRRDRRCSGTDESPPPSVKSLSRLFFWIIRLFKPTTEPKPTATFNLNGESSYLFCMLFCGLYLTVSLFSSSIFGSFWFIFLVFHSLLIITS